MKLLEDSLPKLQGSETPNWIKDLEMKNSPIEGLRSLMDKVIKVLETKKGGLHRLWKDLKWHSEKKHLEEDFNAMDNFCASIQRIIQNAIKDDTSIIKEGTKAIKEDTEDTKERLKRIEDKTDADRNEKRLKKAQKERKEIEEWLSTLNFQARQHEILRGAADTGTWFLDLPAFKIWKEGRLDILQCYGAMGTGKTVLSSIVVEHLVRTMPDIPTLVLYLEETPKESHDPDNLFGSLVKQLIQLRGPADPIPNKIHEAWEKASKIDVPPTPEALEESFSRLVEEKDRVQIVISGLDKATEESRLFVLKSLQKKAGVKLLISARRDVASTDNQINCSVESCKNKALDVYYTCKPCLNENKNNRFDICQDCHRKDVSCPVDEDHEVSLPKKLEVVITAPDEDLEKYIRQKIEEKMPRTDNDMDPDMESSEAEAEELGKVPCPPKEFAEKEKKHDFLAYAVENWGHHVRLAAKEVGAKAAQFLQDYQRIQAYIQAAWETNVHKNEKWDVRKRIHALHILAITGDNTGNFDQDDIACRIIEILLNSCANDLLDATDDDKQTPLHLASIRGYVKCVELLVKHHAKLDEVDRFGKTAIYSSFVNGNLVTTVTLVEAGAKVSEGGGVSLQKILFAAIDFQSVIAVQKLFEAGADVLAQDENGLTPKKKAIQTGNDEILHLISTSRSLYIKEVPSRKVTELQNDVAELRESTADELILMPSPPTDLKTIPFHGFRASAVELDWNTEEDMESQEDRRELVPVLC
ncbi:putative Serine/threonine-protein phosphatase 6 regulatory ankyrin repeat subunit A [Glarea lozoyensis 74030]|uniref:Putative Serine/threonine-protein phosphatase 6 regulatory ankyrin repeat subunit A n=1 Tax=Glarea lozoyensis (strain ATCC 74030 / MF5533) TaxID=1104152 RepID=H0EVL1_GLAL7|nr:putative Serine/threonine-protein phosphatase 6 regulatory ankyrin repeat subunit A [Glarea lozoyensis 74030]